ncbi:LuxR C-terminal-related transcriptional regulator [Methylocella sp.]|uniref:LuxR C-terminal-related transcriptional regulator n=1 Tax=Methylocella sp. TaxID=1978226 RepID=UPI003783E764
MSANPSASRPTPRRIGDPRWRLRAAQAARSIGTEYFLGAFIDLLEASVRSDAVWVIRYSGDAAPDVVFTRNVPARAERVYAEQCSGLDPFSMRWRTTREAGVFTLAALRDASVEYRRYTELFLPAANVEDELGVFFPVTAHNCFAFFLERETGRFTQAEVERARLVHPALEGLHRAHLGWLFNALRTSDAPETTRLIDRPTLIQDHAGQKVYANDAWNALAAADPSIAAAARAGGDDAAGIVLGAHVLKAETLGWDFPLAPRGRMFVVEPRGEGEARDAARDAEAAAVLARFAPRERDVLDLVMEGASTERIARRLAIGVGAVRNCKTRIYRKAEVASEGALVSRFMPLYAPPRRRARPDDGAHGAPETAAAPQSARPPAPVAPFGAQWCRGMGELAAAVGTDLFHRRLVGFLGATIAHSASWIIRYSRVASPAVIYTSDTPQEVVDFYVARCAELDPFSRHWALHEAPGVRTLAGFSKPQTEGVDPRPYNLLFKEAAKISDELGVFFATVGHFTLGLFLERETGLFDEAEIARAKLVFPILEAFFKAHIGRIFDRLRFAGEAQESELVSRPTLVLDRYGQEIFANASWREAAAADPAVGEAVAAARDERAVARGGFTLKIERFDEYFPLAPSGAMFVLTPREAGGDAPPSRAGALESVLTARERDIFQRLMSGATTGSIAQALKLSKGTVKNLRLRIYRKAGVGSERALVQKYGAAGRVEG